MRTINIIVQKGEVWKRINASIAALSFSSTTVWRAPHAEASTVLWAVTERAVPDVTTKNSRERIDLGRIAGITTGNPNLLKKMEIRNILEQSKEIWGEQKLSLGQMIVVLGKVFGDICRWERNYQKDQKTHTDEDLKKELGNLIASSVRFCDDLGYDPEECINLALESQKKISKEA